MHKIILLAGLVIGLPLVSSAAQAQAGSGMMSGPISSGTKAPRYQRIAPRPRVAAHRTKQADPEVTGSIRKKKTGQ